MGFVKSLGSAGANQGGKERTVTSACPSLDVCTAHVQRPGSVSVRRDGWAACVIKILVCAQPGLVLATPPASIRERGDTCASVPMDTPVITAI